MSYTLMEVEMGVKTFWSYVPYCQENLRTPMTIYAPGQVDWTGLHPTLVF